MNWALLRTSQDWFTMPWIISSTRTQSYRNLWFV